MAKFNIVKKIHEGGMIFKFSRIGRIFAYGAFGPACDADYMADDIEDSDDYVSQAMSKVASMLSISAGKQVSVEMTVEQLRAKIQLDTLYKYLR